MDLYFGMNKRFKAEPEEVFIEDDACLEGPQQVEPNEDCFEYECSPTSSAFVPHREVPAILDGQFFEIVTVNETTCTALCKLCEPRRKTINGSLKATGNFYDHIKRMHISYMAEAETKRGAKRKPRGKKFDVAPLMVEHENLSLPTMFYNVAATSRQQVCTQQEAFNAMFSFVCETMLPTSIVGTESFRAMVEVLSKNNAVKISCPTPQQIESAVEERLKNMTVYLEAILKNREYVCAAADLWKHEDRAFVGITGHTINPGTLERECLALGFRSVKIEDKSDIAKEIHGVLSKYNIQKKVREIVTDNVFQNIEEHSDVFDLGVTVQLQCFSRVLKLVVTSDVTSKAVLQHFLPGDDSGEDSKKYAKVYDSAMTKLTAFWEYLKTSPRASNFCAQTCGKLLPVPSDEWTSKFDAVKVISETENVHKIFNQLQLSPLENDDMNFLIEYVTVMQPFATAFEILKDTQSFRGIVLPTILSIKCRLEAMSGLFIGDNLRILALRGLHERFQMLDIMSSKSYPFLIATISHPAFKMSCLPPELQQNARDVFLQACSTLSEKYTPKTVENPKTDSFFSILKSPKASVDCITNEALRYLTDDAEDLAMLHRYPCVKNIFLQYNTCLSSSAPVERLLRTGNQMLGASIGTGISDKQYEHYLLLQINKVFMRLP